MKNEQKNRQALLRTQVFKIEELTPADYNPRKDLTTDDIEYQQLKKSIQEFSEIRQG